MTKVVDDFLARRAAVIKDEYASREWDELQEKLRNRVAAAGNAACFEFWGELQRDQELRQKYEAAMAEKRATGNDR